MTFTWALYNNDLTITSGGILGVNGAEEVKQRVIVSLQHYWQEYFLNRNSGVPWYELILGSKNREIVESLLRNEILSVPGVLSIVNIQIIMPSISNNRKFEFYADIEVQGATGPTIIDIVLTLRGE